MSEIPELPAHTPLWRPVLPGGLERVMRDGRRRRNRFLGAAGGTSTALVLVAALALAAPAERNDSLRVADPEPSGSAAPQAAPSEDAEPEPSPPAETEGDPSPNPSPAAEAGGSGTAAGTRETASREEQEPEPPAQEDARRPYVEEPRDVAAPAVCQGTPGQIDPVVTSASGCFSGGATTSSAPQGGEVRGTFSYCVPYQEEELELSYDDGREHEVRVHSGTESGPVVWTFSDTVTYTQGPHVRTIGSGRCLEWTGVWDTTLADGSDAPSGEYYVYVTAVPDVVGGHPAGEGEAGGVGFPVTVTEG